MAASIASFLLRIPFTVVLNFDAPFLAHLPGQFGLIRLTLTARRGTQLNAAIILSRHKVVFTYSTVHPYVSRGIVDLFSVEFCWGRSKLV